MWYSSISIGNDICFLCFFFQFLKYWYTGTLLIFVCWFCIQQFDWTLWIFYRDNIINIGNFCFFFSTSLTLVYSYGLNTFVKPFSTMWRNDSCYLSYYFNLLMWYINRFSLLNMWHFLDKSNLVMIDYFFWIKYNIYSELLCF